MTTRSGDFGQRNFMDAIRQNPVPAALIGMGVLWMFTGAAGSRRQPHCCRRLLARLPRASEASGKFGKRRGCGRRRTAQRDVARAETVRTPSLTSPLPSEIRRRRLMTASRVPQARARGQGQHPCR